MTDKAYIVTNEQQEHEVLEQLEKEGFMWIDHINKPTELVPSIEVSKQFPYAIVVDMNISLKLSNYFEHYEIIFDGRKEEKMSEKYVVSREFMDKLEDWKGALRTAFKPGLFVGNISMETFPNVIADWWVVGITDEESNNRLIAIIRWVNGEDVFEVEKPKKWVVRSDNPDEIGSYWYVLLHVGTVDGRTFYSKDATKFDTKEEAESWANSHQEVIEVAE